MTSVPTFAATGTQTGEIDVRLSYKIVELFSEGLYSSPNKAVEELVVNAFDAGALNVHVILSPDLHAQDATIVVIDDGEGMDEEGLRRHWLIGVSNKRQLSEPPRNRRQIGKFGIGKLATYVLSNRLTHISKRDNTYYATSMDYREIDSQVDIGIEPSEPVTIKLRELTQAQAQDALKPWLAGSAFRSSGMKLFGKESPGSWTVTIMSSLKTKVHEIQPGTLSWVLSTGLPLRPDFCVWLNGKKLSPSKVGKGLIKRWVLGKDLAELPRPAPKGIEESEDPDALPDSETRYGLDVPGLGRVSGYVEIYKDLLTGKSDQIDRSYGFFVYVYDRLLNVADGHFGISPNELRHGTFGRFRMVVHMDGLDSGLRSNREAVSEGPLLSTAQDVLRAAFNAARPIIEAHDLRETPGARLARKLAASPNSLARKPIVDLARAVAEDRAESTYLAVPRIESAVEREGFIAQLEERAKEPATFLSGLEIDHEGSSSDGIVKFDTQTGVLRLNGWHPFVATFGEEFKNRRHGQPLELFAMAEVLAESYLHSIGVPRADIEEFLEARDQLLRHLTNESGRKSALSIANDLMNARNNPRELEEKVCDAFRSLGFDVTPFGKPSEPDGVATAHLPATEGGASQRYSVSLEAKSKEDSTTKVKAKDVDVAAVVRHRDKFKCDHAIVVGPAFPTNSGDESALGESLRKDHEQSVALGQNRTITLVTVDDLARLVRLRPLKRLGLTKMRELFRECALPQESAAWIEAMQNMTVETPPYQRIVDTIEELQKKFSNEEVNYAALRVELTHLQPPIKYETDGEIADLCKAMAQMAPGAVYAGTTTVELDQSAANAIASIEAAIQEYPLDEQPASSKAQS